ncbi:MFS transporter [Shouchella lonarensis]|uniref:Predicted arabinose efflux permease, MFS family n=1 Tax=Shouchella lonarensis TaxID=1464122 RepID=A0A1G6MAK8_9BACI|nr:MFS transporter [Shouchella lonarensis]SDC52016.1 Predicted arabinose efflux permease, MFS family [Shouchella lonarensis]
MFLSVIKEMKMFLILWIGQVFSIVGIGITSFALGVWVYIETGSVTAYALIAFFALLPDIILSPVAGVFVDRWNKRKVMLICDIAGAVIAFSLVTIVFVGQLEIWYIYLAVGINSVFKAFQWLGYYSSVSLLVPKQHFGRAGGLLQAGETFSKLLGPLLGAVFLELLGVKGVLILNLVTYSVAVISILMVKMSKAKPESTQNLNFIQEMRDGFKYLFGLRGLVWLLVFFMCVNLSVGTLESLVTPLVLGFSNSQSLGYIMSASGVGMLGGSMLISFWGGPKKGKINMIVIFGVIQGLLVVWVGLLPNLWSIGFALFGAMFCGSVMAGCSQALWIATVSPDIQGRVFAIRGSVAWSTLPLAFVITGPLSDNIFEPLFRSEDNILVNTVGAIIGTGEGRGAAFIIIMAGIFIILITTLFLFNKKFRGIEGRLLDKTIDSADNKEETVGI